MEAYVRCVNSNLKDLRAIFVSPATVAQWISSADSKNMDLVPAVTHISDRDNKKRETVVSVRCTVMISRGSKLIWSPPPCSQILWASVSTTVPCPARKPFFLVHFCFCLVRSLYSFFRFYFSSKLLKLSSLFSWS